MNVSETGLPHASVWQLGVAGNSSDYWWYNSSNATDLPLFLTNGSYRYRVASEVPGFIAFPSNGSLSVEGNGTDLTVRFYPGAVLTFARSGVPDGQPWWVNVSLGSGGDPIRQTALRTTMAFVLPIGPCSFVTGTRGGFEGSPRNGSIDLLGDRTVNISFAGPTVWNGYISGTVNVGTATLYLNGYSTLYQLGGGFFLNLTPGFWAILVTAPGYIPFYNVSYVQSNETILMTIDLQGVPSPIPSPPAVPPVLSVTAELLVGLLLTTTVAFGALWTLALGPRRGGLPGTARSSASASSGEALGVSRKGSDPGTPRDQR